MASSTYVIAIGSNRRSRRGSPERTVAAAIAALGDVIAASAILRSEPIGPSSRRFANAVAILTSDEPPPMLLRRLKAIERAFGRRPGRRWGARPLDLDIILWSSGAWAGDGLVIPHPRFRERRFVLDPLAEIAPGWVDPITGRTIRQLARRLRRQGPVDRTRPHA